MRVLTRKQIPVVILCTMASTAMCVAQLPVSFKAVTNNPVNLPSAGLSCMYSADLNNDGLTDTVQDLPVEQYTGHFAARLANPNGTFKSPVYYSYPIAANSPVFTAMALADFNGDGNVDVVMANLGTTSVTVYLGKGDGTFQAPKTHNLDLAPDFFISSGSRVVAADFDHDGNVDLVLSAQSYNFAYQLIYVVPGKGDGTFAVPRKIYQGSLVGEMIAGDFDGDTNADIAFMESSSTNQAASYSVHVLHGDGHFGFSNVSIYTSPASEDNDGFYAILGAGDLDGDGRTDIILTDVVNRVGSLNVFYGRKDRKFDGFSSSIPAVFNLNNCSPAIQFADFNDDGRMDFSLVAPQYNSQPAGYLAFFLGTGRRGEFTTQLLDLPGQYDINFNAVDAVAGLFNRDDKPDLALLSEGSPSNSASEVTLTELNREAHGVWSNCSYPLNGRGISLCSPTSSADGPVTSPVNFSAAAHSFGQLRKMELWVDGRRLSEQSHAWENSAFFNFTTANLPPGAHKGTLVVTDIDNTEQSLDFDFTVGASNCSPPRTDAVRICSLIPSSAGVLAQASATVSGSLARMELWADGAKEYTETTSNHLSVSIALSKGTHELTVVAVNTAGALWRQTANVTIP